MSRVAVIGIVGNSVFLPVEKFHIGGETVEASDVRFELGGKGFNQAVAAARMGADVSFLAAVGAEDEAKISSFLKGEGITAQLSVKNMPTAFAAIVTNREGANRVTVFQGAKLEICDIFAFESQILAADILLLNNEVPEEINLAAMRIAKAGGVKIILNPAPYRKTEKELLDAVYIFTPNEHEAEGLDTYPNVIQTLGEAGCLIKSENEIIPSIKVKAVDTTGAGDTFNGVLAAALAEGKTVNEAVSLAVRASGISVTGRGAVNSIPFKKDITEV